MLWLLQFEQSLCTECQYACSCFLVVGAFYLVECIERALRFIAGEVQHRSDFGPYFEIAGGYIGTRLFKHAFGAFQIIGEVKLAGSKYHVALFLCTAGLCRHLQVFAAGSFVIAARCHIACFGRCVIICICLTGGGRTTGGQQQHCQQGACARQSCSQVLKHCRQSDVGAPCRATMQIVHALSYPGLVGVPQLTHTVRI